MAITTWAAAGGDWNDAQYQRAWDGPAIFPAKGDITLSSSAPTGKLELFTSPGVASLAISGPLPQVAVGSDVSVAKADLAFTAYAPETGIFYKFVITAPTLTLTGQLPISGDGFVITPDNATLTVVQTFAWDNYGGTWAAASTAWDDVAFAPSAVETGQNQPDAGSLTLTGSAPDFRLSQLWYVPSGSLSLTGFLPSSITGHTFSPSNASLTGLSAGESWDSSSSTWATVSGNWDSGTLTPIVGIHYIFTIDSAGNLVFTPYEPNWPLIIDTDYIAEVILS